jgi:hypothetical protein
MTFSPGAQENPAAREQHGFHSNLGTWFGQGTKQAANGMDEFPALLVINPGRHRSKLQIKVRARGIVLHLLQDKFTQQFIQIDRLWLRVALLHQGEAVVQDPSALLNKMAKTRQLLDNSRVGIRQGELKIISDRFDRA